MGISMFKMGIDLIGYFASVVLFIFAGIVITAVLWKFVDFVCSIDNKVIKHNRLVEGQSR